MSNKRSSTYILGISCYYHDSAACLIKDGNILAAAQEERFSRIKHDPRFPEKAIKYCHDEAGITYNDLDHVVFYDKPLLTFERLLLSYLTAAPKGLRSWLKSMPLWLGQKLQITKIIKKNLGYQKEVLFTEHHAAHAASAFYPSPFESAAILTIDGVGEWATASYGMGEGKDVKLLSELHYPDSVGLLYSAFTYFTGFKVNSGEYKLMGLAPYGKPVYKELILNELVDVKKDGSIRLDLSYFDFLGGLRMTNKRFSRLLGGPPRDPESPITQREMDIAASIQSVVEEIVLKMSNHIYLETKMANLCLAGGVALNCVANGRLLREGPFNAIWIQPAAGDAGGALGAALSVWHQYLGEQREVINGKDRQQGCYLGQSFSNEQIANFLNENRYPYHTLKKNRRARTVAEHISAGKIVGYLSGRMEFGPRALGARSILGDARNAEMQSTINQKIKFRESFRPFAPSVLEEKASCYFELDCPSPYMLVVTSVRPERCLPQPLNQGQDIFKRLKIIRSDIPAVTHIDCSARIQTVNKNLNPKFYRILEEFENLTGFSLVVNTSFNVRGEPIVCTPEDAYRCFMRTKMDILVLEDCILYKEEQPSWQETDDWKNEFVLD